MSASLSVAERSAGPRSSLALLRWALVIVFLWFGGMKFTGYEAAGIAPFIANSPIMSWLHSLLGVQGQATPSGSSSFQRRLRSLSARSTPSRRRSGRPCPASLMLSR